MKEILEVLLSSTQGTILLFAIVLCLLGLISWLIIKKLTSISSIGKDGVKFITENVNGVDVKLIPCNAEKHKQNIMLIKGIIGDEYEKFFISREEVNRRIDAEIQNIQRLALTRAIEHLCLEFGNIYVETPENSLSKMGQILELYLHKDFSKILFNRLEMLKDSSTFLDKSELEIINEIQAITEDTVRSMKLKIKDYILISDPKILYKLFDTAINKIKDSVDEAIKNFLKLSREQQTKILELTKKRTETIENKLESLVGSIEKGEA